MAVTDYTTGCGSLAQSFMQMLGNIIVGYHDIAGLIHYRLNGTFTTGDCSGLSQALVCSLQHIEPERQLVESLFGLDDCGLLTMKVYHNSDTHWEDYVECGEIPQTFLQLLARCIISTGGVTMLNMIIDTSDCESLTPLLDCDVNQYEAERLLVTHLFATDDCGNLLLKTVADTSALTDYMTSCGALRQSLYQMLARCIVLHNGHYKLNIAGVVSDCSDLHSFWTCNGDIPDPERALVENVFATDACGNLVLKWADNSGLVGGQER